jgi:hypothetical protein
VFGLAKTYHRLKNDKDQALTYYKKYLELSPKGSAAAIARDSIAKLEGQPPPAPPATNACRWTFAISLPVTPHHRHLHTFEERNHASANRILL